MKAKAGKCLLRETQMCLEGKDIIQVFFFFSWLEERDM